MVGFRFWQKWLVVMGWAIALYCGIVFTFSGLLNINYPFINQVFWDSGTVPANAVNFQHWIYGVYGAIASTFGLFIVFIASIPFKRKEPWSWYCLTSCITLWFVLDTIISLDFKVYANASNNLFFFIMLMLPLAFTRHHFFHRVNQQALQE